MRRWHDSRYLAMAWTVDDAGVAGELAAQGVDVCITNVPRKLRDALAGQRSSSVG